MAVDGTKLTANASSDSNVDYDRIAREIIEEAIATDEAEDEQFGDARGDELPPELQTAAGRRAWLERELARDAGEVTSDRGVPAPSPTREFDPERIGPNGPAWLAAGSAPPLEAQRWRTPARSRARARSGCGSRPGAWRTIWPPMPRQQGL